MLATQASPTTPSVVWLHPDDDICIATRTIPSGTIIEAGGKRVTVSEVVRIGHKIALRSLAKGQPVRKYGQIIGLATEPVRAGDWVHCHNVSLGEFDRDPAPASQTPPPPTPILGRTFQGYRRGSGKIGTRNYVAVISTVNCSASVSKFVS